MHGAGIVAVGNLMDHLIVKQPRRTMPTQSDFAAHLAIIAPDCAWTQGTWKIPGNRRRWNEIQNTRQDVALLTTHLENIYKDRAATPAARGRRPSRPRAAAR